MFAEKMLAWTRKIPFFNDVLFDVFTVLGVYTFSLGVSFHKYDDVC